MFFSGNRFFYRTGEYEYRYIGIFRSGYRYYGILHSPAVIDIILRVDDDYGY